MSRSKPFRCGAIWLCAWAVFQVAVGTSLPVSADDRPGPGDRGRQRESREAPREGRTLGFVTVASSQARNPAPDASAEELATVVAGQTAFALDLYQSLRDEDGNIFYSPYSISTALAMTWAGARDNTEQQIADTLHFDLSQDRLHNAYNALDLALASRSEVVVPDRDPLRLTVVNSLWGQRDYVFLDAFLDTQAVHYGAPIYLVDFVTDPERSRLAINHWVERQTAGQIEDLIPRGIITDWTRLVLTNAIHFKASWKLPFHEPWTHDAEFELLDGGTVLTRMMRVDSQGFGYLRGDGFVVVELPYAGDQLSMVLLVPDVGSFTSFETALSPMSLATIMDELIPDERVKLELPKFSFTYPLPLRDILIALGMPDAFDPNIADLSGMDGTYRLFIRDVQHKAFVAVDEYGTEAAAATAVIVDEDSAPLSVRVDRPFLFAIRDRPTGTILFLGRVIDPTR